MFHPLWEDVGGNVSAERDVKIKPQKCSGCDHSTVVHRANGACYAESCLCGWSKDMNGATFIRSTGEYRRRQIMAVPCYFCGERPETIDHLIARSKGGTSDWSNLVSACSICNGMKGDKSYDEFIAFCVSMETAVNLKTSLRRVVLFQRWKEKARKVLAWHEKRMKSRQAPVV
jgi:hypothetical protein